MRVSELFGFVVLCFLCSLVPFTAQSADEQKARQFVEASDFQGEMLKLLKSNVAVPGAEKALAGFNFKAIEDVYVASLTKHMTNSDIDALLKAYAIPGYREAMRKIPLVTNDMIDATYRESQHLQSIQKRGGK